MTLTNRKIRSALKLLVGGFIIASYIFSLLQAPTTDTQTGETLGTSQESQEIEAASDSDWQNQNYLVTKIRDGDTIEVNLGGKIEAVRLVGIDTPETVDPRKPIQCFGKEASDKLKSLLTGKSVTFEVDETQSDRDRYNRLLRFVFLDGQDVGLQMIREGYAQESLYSSVPHKYRDEYLSAQTEAQENNRGLWNPDACPNPS